MEFFDAEEYLSKQPINIYAKMLAEEPENKLYKQCLENEINACINLFSNSFEDNKIMLLKSLIKIFPDENDPSFGSLDEFTKIQIYSLKKIINTVYDKRFKK